MSQPTAPCVGGRATSTGKVASVPRAGSARLQQWLHLSNLSFLTHKMGWQCSWLQGRGCGDARLILSGGLSSTPGPVT